MSKNSAVELHDSTIAEIKKNDSAVTVKFRPAYVHKSDGTPGVSKGTGWLQDIDLVISNAHISQEPSELGDISDGSLSSAQKFHNNCIPMPCELLGSVKFTALLVTGKTLTIDGESAVIKTIGDARYLEEFK